jgi:hypothetical protein
MSESKRPREGTCTAAAEGESKRPREASDGTGAAGEAAAAAAAAAPSSTIGSACSFDQDGVDGLLSLIRELDAQAGSGFMRALDTLRKMLSNILLHPGERKYRYIRMANSVFHRRLGQYPAGIELLRRFGFEDAVENKAVTDGGLGGVARGGEGVSTGSEQAAVTHLALPVADPGLLTPGLLILEAAKQAAAQQVTHELEGGELAGSHHNGGENAGALRPAAAAAAAVSQPSVVSIPELTDCESCEMPGSANLRSSTTPPPPVRACVACLGRQRWCRA